MAGFGLPKSHREGAFSPATCFAQVIAASAPAGAKQRSPARKRWEQKIVLELIPGGAALSQLKPMKQQMVLRRVLFLFFSSSRLFQGLEEPPSEQAGGGLKHTLPDTGDHAADIYVP